jgi:hypothetical protein
MAKTTWRVAEGRVESSIEDVVRWSGLVDGGHVRTLLTIDGSDDAIVLLDPDLRPLGVETWHPFPNVVRIGSSGNVIWRASPVRQRFKYWYAIEWNEGRLVAFAPSYDVEIVKWTPTLGQPGIDPKRWTFSLLKS